MRESWKLLGGLKKKPTLALPKGGNEGIMEITGGLKKKPILALPKGGNEGNHGNYWERGIKEEVTIIV